MYYPSLHRRSLALLRGHSLPLTLVFVLGLAALLVVRPLLMPAVAPAQTINLDLGKLSLSFVPNAGQTDPTVHFQVHDMGGTIFFTSGEAVLALPASTSAVPSVVHLRFEGTNSDPAVVGVDRLPGSVNYFIGNDPATWYTNLPTYAGVVYQQLYPGIDLRYDGTSGHLKGTYNVAPGADPSHIRWRHDGVTDVRLDEATGNLIITVASATEKGHTLIENAPIAWQEINGQRVPVIIRYVLADDGSVGFALGHYAPTWPLIIDPTLVYGTYLGGSGFEEADGVALDSAGNVYITGATTSTDFPTEHPYQSSSGGEEDVFVAKINAAGDALVYSTYIGGNNDDDANSIAVDSAGNAYITGHTDSTDFPTQNPLQARGGLGDAFVVKLNGNGDGLVYSTYLGGSHIDQAKGIVVDGGNNVYVVGTTFSTSFLTETPLRAYSGAGDAFVAKLNDSGSALVYLTYLGGNSSDFGSGIAVDNDGRTYVFGMTTSSNFPTESALYPDYGGLGDLFVTNLNADGSELLYSTYLGGSGKDYSYGIAIDSAGNAHVTGQTESADFPTTTGAFDTTCGTDGNCNNDTGFYSYGDAFVSKLNTSGGALLYSTYLGGSGMDKGYSIAVDSAGNAYVTGDTFSADFPTEHSIQVYSSSDGQTSDAFVAKLETDGSDVIYSTYLGGSSGDHGTGIAVDGGGSAFVVGITFSEDFPTENPLQGTHGGGYADAFVVKLEGEETPPPSPGPNLAGSYKSASQSTLAPGEELTYTVHLQNSGTADTTAGVVDQLPAEVDYVADSASGGGVYDSGAGTVSWSDVAVGAGEEVLLTFEITVATVETPTLVVNTATITSSGESFERQATVLLVSKPTGDDVIPPVVHSLTIDEQDVLTNPDVTLHISASDNVAVTQMYLKEWQLVTTPVPHWEVAQTSGWIPYQTDAPWTLGSESGVHFVGVWVADEADNISYLSGAGLDYASLLLPGETVGKYRMVPYLVHYEAGENVIATLTTTSGDADLYVWFPNKFGPPDEYSIEPGTTLDEVTFTTPSAGTYLFLVYGYKSSTYDLSITPVGGPRAAGMAGNLKMSQGDQTSLVVSDEMATANSKTPQFEQESVLTWSGVDPLAGAQSPGRFVIYLPMVMRASTTFWPTN